MTESITMFVIEVWDEASGKKIEEHLVRRRDFTERLERLNKQYLNSKCFRVVYHEVYR